jgi:hypothetical protein
MVIRPLACFVLVVLLSQEDAVVRTAQAIDDRNQPRQLHCRAKLHTNVADPGRSARLINILILK